MRLWFLVLLCLAVAMAVGSEVQETSSPAKRWLEMGPTRAKKGIIMCDVRYCDHVRGRELRTVSEKLFISFFQTQSSIWSILREILVSGFQSLEDLKEQ